MKLHEQRRKMEGTLDSIERRTEVRVNESHSRTLLSLSFHVLRKYASIVYEIFFKIISHFL
jgi:hypothetical protein